MPPLTPRPANSRTVTLPCRTSAPYLHSELPPNTSPLLWLSRPFSAPLSARSPQHLLPLSFCSSRKPSANLLTTTVLISHLDDPDRFLPQSQLRRLLFNFAFVYRCLLCLPLHRRRSSTAENDLETQTTVTPSFDHHLPSPEATREAFTFSSEAQNPRQLIRALKPPSMPFPCAFAAA